MSHKSKGISTPVEFGAELCSDVKAVASWHYDWSPTPLICPGDNVPMVWGLGALRQLEQGTLTLGGNSIYVLGFNEPDLASQANMKAGACARYWRRLEALYPNKLLISPAPSGKDYQYLERMRNQYISRYGTPPKFAALACHSYGSTTNLQAVLSWMTEKAEEWNIREVWLTEYGLQPPFGTEYFASIAYMHQCMDIMNQFYRVSRYAWFTSRHPWYDAMCCFRWETGALTEIGAAYKNL